MRVSLKVVMPEVCPLKWAADSNGPWPEEDKRALNTAVRQDIRDHVQYLLNGSAKFEDLGIKVIVE